MRRIFIAAVAIASLFLIGAIAPAVGQRGAIDRGSASAGARAQPGSVGTADVFAPTYDMVFNATEPCRVVDTRFGGGGRLAVNAVRSYRVLDDEPSNYTDQGGINDFCGTSPVASAIAINITAVDPSGRGFVRAWPYDEPTPPVPNATILNYSTALNASNGLNLMVCSLELGGTCTKDIFVKNFGATTNLIIDVLGYFTRQTFAAVDGETGGLVDGNLQAFTSERTGEGEYVVTFFQILPFCGWVAALEGGATGQISSQLDDSAEPVPTLLLVHTTDSAGLPADRSFQVFLRC